MAAPVGDRALVLGGSMAGLLAARVLAEYYAEVVVVDRDEMVGVTAPRRGVPQGRHVHGLLARGQAILEELFPGFTARAAASGAHTGDLGELRWYFGGRQARKARTGLRYISATRPVLESYVRERVLELPNIRLEQRCDILGLISTSDGGRILGARVSRAGDNTAESIEADLVIDATGRGSRTPAWLAELGYERPPEQRIHIDLTYTTRYYRSPPEDFVRGDKSINPVASPAFPRGAFFSAMEHGRWVLSLTGVLGDRPPTDPDGFLEYVRSLPVPGIYEAVREAEPLDDPVAFRYPASVRVRYEQLSRLPAGLLVLGDAACSFNPVYGQGMTVAAIEALVLRDQLRTGVPEPLRFARELANVIDVPWDISAGGDLAFAEVPGDRPAKVRIGNAYMSRAQAAATRDPKVLTGLMRVLGLVDSPQSMMRPTMLLRVLR